LIRSTLASKQASAPRLAAAMPPNLPTPMIPEQRHHSVPATVTMIESLRLRLFLSHLAISAAIIGACVAFIVLAWYPPPLAQLEGVFTILLVMAGVDVGAGPLCTLVAASPKKTRGHLARDLAVIATVQLAALGYTVYTTFIARPAFIVYSVGQFEVEHANELQPEQLAKASLPAFASAPLFGPVYVEARFPEDPKEAARIVNSAIMTGFDIKDMPRYYRPWPSPGLDARDKGKPASALSSKSALADEVATLLKKHGVAEADALVFPIARTIDRGTVVVRESDLAVLGIVLRLRP